MSEMITIETVDLLIISITILGVIGFIFGICYLYFTKDNCKHNWETTKIEEWVEKYNPNLPFDTNTPYDEKVTKYHLRCVDCGDIDFSETSSRLK